MRRSTNQIRVKLKPMTFKEPISPSYKKILLEQKVLEKAQQENMKRNLSNLSLDEPMITEKDLKEAEMHLEVTDYFSIEEKIKEAQENKERNNFLLASEICQNIVKRLDKYSILTVDDKADIIIEVSVKKMGWDTLYGPRPIADIVVYKGIMNGKVIFSGEFNQNYKGWFFLGRSIKNPQQIGAILAKKIVKDIKKLSLHRKR